MNVRIDHLLTEASKLPAQDRSALVVALLDGLEGAQDPSIEQEWLVEVLRRRESLRNGESIAIPWTEAKARLAAL
jgi:putative addiction module component (TIGR02574 family)